MFYAGIILFLLTWLVLKVVPEGSVLTLTRFGKLQRILGPGPHLIIPLIDRVASSVNLRIQTLELPAHSSYSRDGVRHSVSLTLVYMVKDPVQATFGVKDLKNTMSVLSYKAINTVLAVFPASRIMHSRNKLTAMFALDLSRSLARLGVEVVETDVREIRAGKSGQRGSSAGESTQTVRAATQTVVEMRSPVKAGTEKRSQARNTDTSTRNTKTVGKVPAGTTVRHG